MDVVDTVRSGSGRVLRPRYGGRSPPTRSGHPPRGMTASPARLPPPLLLPSPIPVGAKVGEFAIDTACFTLLSCRTRMLSDAARHAGRSHAEPNSMPASPALFCKRWSIWGLGQFSTWGRIPSRLLLATAWGDTRFDAAPTKVGRVTACAISGRTCRGVAGRCTSPPTQEGDRAHDERVSRASQCRMNL